MSDKSKISWTDATFNPWMGCAKVSPGCAHCYAERMLTDRMGRPGLWGPKAGRQVTSDQNWKKPLKWNAQAAKEGKRTKAFCGSLCDWAEDHPTSEAARPRLWELIRATPHLDWLLLTKRAERIAMSLPDDWGRGYPNVWLGVSIESNDYRARADQLRRVPAVVRFISYEPALGPLDRLDLTGIDWVIYGGESGPKYREHDLAWPRQVRAMCRAAGVAFFYKQSPAIRTEMKTTLDGETIREMPVPRKIASIERGTPATP
jgi:protein gp37